MFAVPVISEDCEKAKLSSAAEDGSPLRRYDKASIAVLAFANMTGDATQDYVSDGITDDIITELSRFQELTVIARNSTFHYKGRTASVREIGQELGVRYVLEGSVRRTGTRMRVTSQLVEADTAANLWAERYDLDGEDIFSVQDEMARSIASILVTHLGKAEVRRTLLKPPSSLQAYDYYLQGAAIFTAFLSSLNVDQLYEARNLFGDALAIDGDYARALAALSNTYVVAWNQALDDDFLREEPLDRAYELARRAVQIDPQSSEARAQLGWVTSRMGAQLGAVAEFEKAVLLNPNFHDRRYGVTLVYAGQPEMAIEVLKRHLRLDPFHTPISAAYLGLAHYMAEQYPAAVAQLRECTSRAPNFRPAHIWLAATYARMGQMAQASAHVREVLRIVPTYTIEGMSRRLMMFTQPRDSEHFFGGLYKAGFPSGKL